MLKLSLANRANKDRSSVSVMCVSSSRGSLVSSWKGVKPGKATTGQGVWETLA